MQGYLTPLYSYVLQTGESPNFITTVFGNIVKIHQIHTYVFATLSILHILTLCIVQTEHTSWINCATAYYYPLDDFIQ